MTRNEMLAALEHFGVNLAADVEITIVGGATIIFSALTYIARTRPDMALAIERYLHDWEA